MPSLPADDPAYAAGFAAGKAARKRKKPAKRYTLKPRKPTKPRKKPAKRPPKPRPKLTHYTTLFNRVHWMTSSVDDSSPHCAVRLFGFYRAKRLWVLLETTGTALAELSEMGRTDQRRGIDVRWLPVGRMRSYLYMLGRVSVNTVTREFVADCMAAIDRINRVKIRYTGDSVYDASKDKAT